MLQIIIGRNVIAILCSFSEYNNKPFRQITREDILAFLDSFRRPESIDPQHKWMAHTISIEST